MFIIPSGNFSARAIMMTLSPPLLLTNGTDCRLHGSRLDYILSHTFEQRHQEFCYCFA